MSRTIEKFQPHSLRAQLLSTFDFRTRLNHLGLLDWFVIALGVVGICTAIYLQTLRHP